MNTSRIVSGFTTLILIVVVFAIVIKLALNKAYAIEHEAEQINSKKEYTHDLFVSIVVVPVVIALIFGFLLSFFISKFGILSAVVVVAVWFPLLYDYYYILMKKTSHAYSMDAKLRDKFEKAQGTKTYKIRQIYIVPARGRDVINLWVTGLTHRFLFITEAALSFLTPPELKAVVMHEMGHHHYKHTLKFCVLNIVFLSFFEYFVYSLNQVSWIVALISAIVIYIPYFLLFCAVSRHFEKQADTFAANIAGKEEMINALKKIEMYNKSPKLSKIDALFAFHPSTEKRIAVIREGICK
ncbi:MAG: M48 family metalloprotease [Candidatus Thermoplasmatota archaeon]|nr:M48 family metalloprotease [Candidatus Thermoplasmatota archaeon]